MSVVGKMRVDESGEGQSLDPKLEAFGFAPLVNSSEVELAAEDNSKP